jgi:hypothetical protein
MTAEVDNQVEQVYLDPQQHSPVDIYNTIAYHFEQVKSRNTRLAIRGEQAGLQREVRLILLDAPEILADPEVVRVLEHIARLGRKAGYRIELVSRWDPLTERHDLVSLRDLGSPLLRSLAGTAGSTVSLSRLSPPLYDKIAAGAGR